MAGLIYALMFPLYMFYRAGLPHEIKPLGLHEGMFIPTIEMQGTNSQVEKLLKKAKNFEMIGTYAQTELGHGTIINFDQVCYWLH